MSARDELYGHIYGAFDALDDPNEERDTPSIITDVLLAAGYRKPRTVTTAEELEKLPYGSAVQTSDESDTAVLKDKGAMFRNQSGCELSATDLWRFGTHPFTVIYSPADQ